MIYCGPHGLLLRLSFAMQCKQTRLEIFIAHNLLISHMLQVERLSHSIALPQVIHQRASLKGFQTINNQLLPTSFAFPSNVPRASLFFPRGSPFSFAPESLLPLRFSSASSSLSLCYACTPTSCRTWPRYREGRHRVNDPFVHKTNVWQLHTPMNQIAP